MPRPSKINEALLLERLKAGITDTAAAKEIPVSREAVRQKRVKFVAQGLLPLRHQLKLRTRRVRVQKVSVKPGADHELTLEQVEEVIITRFREAAEVERLRNQLAATSTLLKNREAELEELKRYYAEREDKRKQFKLAQQQGDIKSLL